MTRDILYRLGIQPTLVTNGVDAVQMALERELDVIFMAVDLPDLDGIVATARIREFESENPSRQRVAVVGLTSAEPEKAEPVLIRIGMDAVLERPSGFLAMSACLRKVCPGHVAPAGNPGAKATPPPDSAP